MFTALENKEIQVLVPRDGFSWETFLTAPGATPFSDYVMKFGETVSRILLNDPRTRAFPDAIALGFWLRPSHLKKMCGDFYSHANEVFIGRGVVFHLAPGNVDTMFVYTLFIGLLAGNRNIVRVGAHNTEQQTLLFDILNEAIRETPDIAQKILVVRYGHDDEVTAYFSSHCQVRVIWGGDDTVNHIRQIPLPAGSSELAFSGKFSFAVIDTGAEMEKIAPGFVTDVFSFGQQGCSSPKLICWIGDDDDGIERFWLAVEKELKKRLFTLSPAEVASRWTAANAIAMASAGKIGLRFSTDQASFLRLELSDWDGLSRSMNSGNGLFFELHVHDLEEVLCHSVECDQTVVSAGISHEQWEKALKKISPIGIVRIVPPGKALEFSPVWDGHKLLYSMTKIIELGV